MKAALAAFYESLAAQLSPDSRSYKKFIAEKTFINGEPFSFKDHEYQEYIVDLVEANPGCTFSVLKPSQIGLSEIFNRLVLARMALMPGTGVLISFPSKTFSQEVLKTRISSIIRESPTLSGLIDHNNDSASVKQFHNGSIVYALGGSKASSTTLLNRAIQVQFIDEIDRQDKKIVAGYESRTTHAKDKDLLVINLSTPTADGIGISAKIQESYEVHTAWIGCPCGHEFIGDYFEHVRLPGYDEPLQLLTEAKASTVDLSKAYLECPECKGEITGENKRTVWKVTYNDVGGKDKIGIVLDPFVAMGFISMPRLVKRQLNFGTNVVEFLNQALAKVADKRDSSIDRKAIKFVNTAVPVGSHIYGLDLGKLCFYMHGVLRPDTTVHVMETHIVKLADLEKFLEDQNHKYVFAAAVADSQPYSDLIYRLIRKYQRLFSAIYVAPTTPIPEMYKLKLMDKHEELVRQITINKSIAFDAAVGSLADFYTFQSSPLDATIVEHFLDMRRVRDHRYEEMIYRWVKSEKGNDHAFHAFIYLHMAAKLALANVNSVYSVPFSVRKLNTNKKPDDRR
jgi:hypothetical protein